MKKIYKILFITLTALGLCGCSLGKEIGHTPLVRAVVITKEEEYTVQLIVHSAAAQGAEILTGSGETVPAAYLAATSRFSELPYMGHLQAVFLCEEICHSGQAREVAAYLAQIAGVRIKAALFILENAGTAAEGDAESFLNATANYIEKLEVPQSNLISPYMLAGSGNSSLPKVHYDGEELLKTACMVSGEEGFLFEADEYLQELDILMQKTHTAFYNTNICGQAVSFQLSDLNLFYTPQKVGNEPVVHIYLCANVEQLMARDITLQGINEKDMREKLESYLAMELMRAIEKVYIENGCDLFGFSFYVAQIPNSENAQQNTKMAYEITVKLS